MAPALGTVWGMSLLPYPEEEILLAYLSTALRFRFVEPLSSPQKQKHLLPHLESCMATCGSDLPGGSFSISHGGPLWAEFAEFRGKRDG